VYNAFREAGMKEKRKAGKPDIQSIVRKRVTRKMPRKALKERIATFLASRNMCVLATCAWDVPRATPLEYHSDGTTLYMMVETGRKIENILENPNVSVGIYGPYKGWLSVKGVQITGVGEILTVESGDEFIKAAAIFPWKRYAKELGLTKLPANARFLKVEAAVIEFIDISLKAEGYAAGQIWTR
jgi:uncharacterized protein YhbP (UPF0306 family)